MLDQVLSGKADLERAVELRVRKAKLLQALIPAAMTSTHSLVKFSDTPAGRNTLNITKLERTKLIAALEQALGTVVRKEPNEEMAAVEVAGASLYHFLTKRGWKADEQ
jgi:hypothetical protein